MMIFVDRDIHGPRGTLSKVFLDGDGQSREHFVFEAYGLEDRQRDTKVKGDTAIPDGVYDITSRKEGGFYERYKVRFRPWHRGMLWVRNVPNFEFILIHCGNATGDTEGCLLVGMTRDTDKFTLANSALAYQELYLKVIADAEANTLKIEYRTREH